MKLDLSRFWNIFDIPVPVAEFRFHPDRRWRFDFAWVSHRLAVEVEGGLWIGGRHNRPVSMVKDMEKYNEAALMGWKVLRFTPQQFKNGDAAEVLQEFFNGRKT